MKKTLIVAMLGLAGLMAGTAVQAQTTRTGNFAVNVTLTPACTFTGTSVNLSYTSGSASAVSGSSNLSATCTTGLPYTINLADTALTIAGLSVAVGLDNGSGVFTSTTRNFTGNGSAQTLPIQASISAGQAGSCTGTTITGGTSGNPTVCAGSANASLTLVY